MLAKGQLKKWLNHVAYKPLANIITLANIIKYTRMEFSALDQGGNKNNIYRYSFKNDVILLAKTEKPLNHAVYRVLKGYLEGQRANIKRFAKPEKERK